MLFCCDNCGCVDDTDLAHPNAIVLPPGEFLCSYCRPIKTKDGLLCDSEWHGCFPKETYDPQLDVVCNRPNGIGLS